MPELQVRVGAPGVQIERFAVGAFARREVSGLLEGMTVLHPQFRSIRSQIERLSVISRCKLPVSPIARPGCCRRQDPPPTLQSSSQPAAESDPVKSGLKWVLLKRSQPI